MFQVIPLSKPFSDFQFYYTSNKVLIRSTSPSSSFTLSSTNHPPGHCQQAIWCLLFLIQVLSCLKKCHETFTFVISSVWFAIHHHRWRKRRSLLLCKISIQISLSFCYYFTDVLSCSFLPFSLTLSFLFFYFYQYSWLFPDS